MQNFKKRRGISLSHHQHHINTTQTLDKSAYIQAETTRMQYPRYQIQHTPSRHASAPKTKVQFVYPVQFAGAIQSTPKKLILPVTQVHSGRINQRSQLIRSNCRVEVKLDQTNVIPNSIISENTQPEIRVHKQRSQTHQEQFCPSIPIQKESRAKSQVQEIAIQNIPQKYVSFEQCKQTIGRRLFGVGSIKKLDKQNTLRQSDRSNRWLERNTQHVCSQVSIQSSVIQATDIKQQTGHLHRKPHLQIQRQVVKHVEKKYPNENQPPAVVLAVEKKEMRRRDPQKLLQMEKRLMEIIKICDQNLC